jgi:hypothetical protein
MKLINVALSTPVSSHVVDLCFSFVRGFNAYLWTRSHSSRQATGKTLHEIEKEIFRLPPTLVNQLAARRYDLHNGTGILLLRGLRPKKRSQRENFVLFAGLTCHLSEQRGRQPGNKYLGGHTCYLYISSKSLDERSAY